MKEAMKLALEALQTLHDENMDYLTRNKLGGENNQCMVFAREAIKALEEALAKQEQGEPVAHCEAGPDYCQQCHLEDESLALAAAVRYVKNNAPKLVSDEICNALNHIPNAKKMVASGLLKRVHDELMDVLNSINKDKIHHDGDDFHELLRDVEQAAHGIKE
jgi:hypothetical protein